MHRILKHSEFSGWYMKQMIVFHRQTTGEGEVSLKTKLKDSLVEEINQLSFVIDGFYPHSRPDNKGGFMFITDPIHHFCFEGGGYGMWYPGRATLTFKNHHPVIVFEDAGFRHAHLKEDGVPTCYGGYRVPWQTATQDGMAGMLSELHLFASRSAGSTYHSNKGIMPKPVEA